MIGCPSCSEARRREKMPVPQPRSSTGPVGRPISERYTRYSLSRSKPDRPRPARNSSEGRTYFSYERANQAVSSLPCSPFGAFRSPTKSSRPSPTGKRAPHCPHATGPNDIFEAAISPSGSSRPEWHFTQRKISSVARFIGPPSPRPSPLRGRGWRASSVSFVRNEDGPASRHGLSKEVGEAAAVVVHVRLA